MADDDVEQVTDEEKLQIAQHFLLSSPPGQFHEVLSDVRKLLPDGLLGEPLAAGIARAFHTKNSKIVVAPSGSKVVINAAGEIDPTHYVDTKTGSTFGIDHLSLVTVEASSPSNQDRSLENERAALQSTLDAYVANRYVSEDTAAGVFARDGKILAILIGEKPNLRNFWSGKWASNWSITISRGQANVTGDIKIHAHYFEDGNVQLQSTKQFPSRSFPFTSESDFAAQITAYISSCETDLQSGLEEMYANMNDETFRAMRRIMPVKRTKMEWNVNAVRMNKQVRK